MLKVAPDVVIRSYGRTSKFFRLDGLLLFCIIMGLRSASSAVIPIIIVFIFFINFSLVSLEKNVCGEDSQQSIFRKITSCEPLRFSRDYSKTCCPDNLKMAEQSHLHLTF